MYKSIIRRIKRLLNHRGEEIICKRDYLKKLILEKQARILLDESTETVDKEIEDVVKIMKGNNKDK